MKTLSTIILGILLFNSAAFGIIGAKAAKDSTSGTTPLINVDFGSGRTASAKIGLAATGQSAGDFWNWYTCEGPGGVRLTLGTIPNLRSASGELTGATLTAVNLPGSWSSGSTDPMYWDYIYPFDGISAVVLSNVPPGKYNLLIYSHDGNYELQTLTTNYGVRTCLDQPLSVPLVWTEGVQYAAFRKVEVIAGDLLTLVIRNGKRGYAVISGMQLSPADNAGGTPPGITTQPQNQNVSIGASATFSVLANGTEPLAFQWHRDGAPLVGATASSFTIPGVQYSDVAIYTVQITNQFGRITSAPASLTVIQSTTNRIINIDFGAGLIASAKVGPAAVGVASNDFWNWYTRDNPDGSWSPNGAIADLKYQDGTSSGAGLQVRNARGAWGNGSSDPMYLDYVYPLEGETAGLTITNLVPGKYELYVYSHDGNYQLTVADTDYGLLTNFDSPLTSPPAWASGKQYSLFTDISVGASKALQLTVRNGQQGWAIISGLQLVQVSTTPSVTAPLINVDFGSGRTSSAKVGLAATGQSATDFWNWYSCEGPGGVRLTLGSITNLLSAKGELTGIRLTAINLPGSWSNGSTDPMYWDYIYPFSGISSVILSNLPAGNYDLLVYSHDGNYELQSSSTNYGIRTCLDQPLSTPLVWTEGTQYAAFRNVRVAVGETLTMIIRNGVRGTAVISGMQLSPVGDVSGTAPVIRTQPLSQTVKTGSTVTFSVSATGTQPLAYQWRFNGNSLTNSTANILTLENLQESQAGAYSVEVKNAFGTAVSADAVLTVGVAPLITAQPVSQSVQLGTPVTFNVAASGTEPMFFQWLQNGVSLAGKTTTTLSIPSAQYPDFGSYTVLVTNAFGRAESASASLSIVKLVTNSIINIDFGAGRSSSAKVGPAAIGVSNSDFWNWYTRDNPDGSWRADGALPELRYQDGAPSGAGIEIRNAPGAWGNGSTDPMYYDYIYPLQGDTAEFTVTNLPTGKYDLYVYAQDGSYALAVGTIDYGVSTNVDWPLANPLVWVEGIQYSLFRDIEVVGTDSIKLTVRNGKYGWAIISGLQLVRTSITPPNSAPIPVIEVSPQAHFTGWTNLIVIAPNNQTALVTLDGSKSHDVEDAALKFYWSEGGELFSTEVSTKRILGIGTHTITLLVDDTHPRGTNGTSIAVEVITPSQGVVILLSMLQDSNLPSRSLRPLEASLGAAVAAFESSRPTPGVNQLAAFQNKVRAQIAPFDPVLAEQLISAAQSIIDAIGK